MRSIQEQIVHKLSEGQIGAPYVFFPEKWSKKRDSQREPCDIVIACNNCIVLMYMTCSKASRFEKIDHNLKKQAKGWIKAWKGGQNLRGVNGSFRFDIPYGMYKHVVVVSVINCPDDLAENHEKERADYCIDICITMPQSAIEYFALTGAGLADFLKILKLVQSANAQINALELMKSYFNRSKEIGDPMNVKITHKEAFKLSVYLLLSARSAKIPNKTVEQIDYPLKEIYNDLYLHDFVRICTELALIIEDDQSKLKTKKEVYAVMGLTVENYIYLIAINVIGDEKKRNELLKTKDQLKCKTQNFGIPIVSLQRYPDNSGYSSILIADHGIISNCEKTFSHVKK